MREIKFRVFNSNNKSIKTDVMFTYHNTVWVHREHTPCNEEVYILRQMPDDYKVCQYTGLKDKNGKEIYEGDIVNHKYWVMSGMMFEDELNGPRQMVKTITKEDGTTERIFLPPPPIFYRKLVNKPLYEKKEIFKVKIPNFYYRLERIREGSCYETCKETAKYLEIIGNIYENPELLEKKDV